MVTSRKNAKVTYPAPGITRRVMAHSKNIMLTEHMLEKDAVLPDHKHPHEQAVYVLSGELMLEINGKQYHMDAGDSLVVASNANHMAKAIQPSVVLDIFSPSREDYV